jgi:hypothetical protein
MRVFDLTQRASNSPGCAVTRNPESALVYGWQILFRAAVTPFWYPYELSMTS